jgi:hypothetical protein
MFSGSINMSVNLPTVHHVRVQDTFSQNPPNLAPVADLMRESAHLIEWCAPESDLESHVALLELQCHLAQWRMRLPQRFPDQAWRAQVIAEAQRWSQRVLKMGGLLAKT